MDETLPQPVKLPRRARIAKYLRGLAVRLVVYLLVYFVIAILSIGPCFWSWFEATYVDGPKWVAKFYAPLLWVCDHCEPLSRLVNNYIEWWVA